MSALGDIIIENIDKGENNAVEIIKSANLLNACHMLRKAWNEITGQIIANCFRRAGFLQNEDVSCDKKNLIEIPHITSETEK
ncbi:hypothetical protein SteCoe_36409 [Stentor coeruleus]|uniref:DDE-1 domain-containing protein n=1 Tax=Stentor coeruleus TaxID=5963 RepID=A0A1R2AQB1_9CILI|nr:hypothetical protein SteCoe_36409 [Stentor coeruleus]